MLDSPPKKANKTLVFSIMAALALWLLALLVFASWYQARYIKSFTQDTPTFLEANQTERWFAKLTPLLPNKTTSSRVIQFWQPDCLCNRFARPHALSATNLAKELGIEHITVIPNRSLQEVNSLQALNPHTKIISLNTNLLEHWPASPSLLIEDPLARLIYFGPLGFGAFCGQASTSVINSQMLKLQESKAKPFFNIIGKGCFCPWK